jgi:ribonuclease-3
MTQDEFAREAGLTFDDPSLLLRALTHRSYVNEHADALEDNERLEFLGDATLDFISAMWLYHRFPEMNEGQLTRLRASLVCTEQLGRFAADLGLGEVLLLGQGEHASGGRQRPALLCDAFEALIGALYLDGGFERVREFIEPRFERAVEQVLNDEALIDARSRLQMWAQAELGVTPLYQTLETSGPDHSRTFIVEVVITEDVSAKGSGKSKQEAAQQAAQEALKLTGELRSNQGGM